jgi:hypothetical protein
MTWAVIEQTGQFLIIAYYPFLPASRRRFAQEPAALKFNRLAEAANFPHVATGLSKSG